MEEVPLLPLPPPEERRKLREELMGLTLAQAVRAIGETQVPGVPDMPSPAPNTLRRWEKGYPMTADNHRRYQAAITRWQEIIATYTQQ